MLRSLPFFVLALMSTAGMGSAASLSIVTFEDGSGRPGRYATAGSGQPVLVIPGGPGLGYRYLAEPLAALLSDDLRLVFLDPPLCPPESSTGTEPGCRFEGHVAEVGRVVRHLGFERLDLLAHSFGGLVALDYCLGDDGDRVERLVLVDGDPASRGEWAGFRQVLEERRTAPQAARLESLTAAPGWADDPETIASYLATLLEPYFASPATAADLRFELSAREFAAFRSTTQAVRADLGDWDFREQLASLDLPVLLLYGEETIYPRSSILELHQRLPSARLEILPGVGHFAFLEAPARFRELVAGFLAAGRP